MSSMDALNYVPVVGVLRGMRTASKRAMTIPLRFEFVINKISLTCPNAKDRPLQVEWRQGSHAKAITESATSHNGNCHWQDSIIKLRATMYKQNNGTTFLTNKTQLQIVAPSLKNKVMGYCDLDLGLHAGFSNNAVNLQLKKTLDDMKGSTLKCFISSKEVEPEEEDSQSESKDKESRMSQTESRSLPYTPSHSVNLDQEASTTADVTPKDNLIVHVIDETGAETNPLPAAATKNDSPQSKSPIVSFALARGDVQEAEELEEQIRKLKEQLLEMQTEREALDAEQEELQTTNQELVSENERLQEELTRAKETQVQMEEALSVVRAWKEERERADAEIELREREKLIQAALDQEKKDSVHHDKPVHVPLPQIQQHEKDMKDQQQQAKIDQLQADRDTLVQVNIQLQEKVVMLEDQARTHETLRGVFNEMQQARQKEIDRHAIEIQKLDFSFNEMQNQNQQLWTRLADSMGADNQERVKELESQVQEAISKLFDVKSAWIDSQQVLDEKATEIEQLTKRLRTCTCAGTKLNVPGSSSSSSASPSSPPSVPCSPSQSSTRRRLSLNGLVSGVTNSLHIPHPTLSKKGKT